MVNEIKESIFIYVCIFPENGGYLATLESISNYINNISCSTCLFLGGT